jgi:RNA polymerase sigma-70 factor (ECF subfamily)
VIETEREAYVRYLNDQYDLLITKVAYDILQNEHQIDDVKQQVLLRLAPKVHVLRTLDPHQVASYVATTTKRIALTQYKNNTTYEERKELIASGFQRTATMDYVEFKAFQGKYGFGEDLWSLMMELPERDREIMIYRFHYQMTTSEIAEIIGTNREQVKKNYQRTRKKLIKLIEERGLELR